MPLYLIGIGLNNEKDITLKGLSTIKKSEKIYLESYTSKLNCSLTDLEKVYNKKLIIADRELVENKDEILSSAKEKNIALLVIGDIFSATTHINLLLEAKKRGIETKIIHNASILTAISEIGLDVYKFGRTVSIPLENKNVKSPIKFLRDNLKLGLHTLILLDAEPLKNKFLSINEATGYLIKNKFSKQTMAIGCSAIGSEEPEIKYATLENLSKIEFKKFPQCIVIPGKLHFVEEEMLRMRNYFSIQKSKIHIPHLF